MNDGQKPFACPVEGCEMTFTNEDHLHWHRKKHDMILNISIANKNSEVADQTPTPTRFIRNCEEVGLFQDLQNVNPFDEFFRKAVEITKSGGTLEVNERTSEDTLHTPHILPHIKECQTKTTSSEKIHDDDNSHSNGFVLNNVIPLTNSCDNEKINEPIVESHEICNGETKILSTNGFANNCEKIQRIEVSQVKDLKLKLKHIVQSNSKRKIASINLMKSTSHLANSELLMQAKSTDSLLSPITKEKIREMNRAAQIRCRKRKAQKRKEMEEELELLRNENKMLKIENKILKKQLIDFGNTVITEGDKHVTEGDSLSISESRANVPIQSLSDKNPNSTLINILPSNITVPIALLPHQTFTVTVENSVDKNYEPVTRRKNLRKIIPKIVIDKC